MKKVALLLILIVLGSSSFAQRIIDLNSPSSSWTTIAQIPQQRFEKARTFTLNESILEGDLEVGDKLQLNLIDDIQYSASITKINKDVNGVTAILAKFDSLLFSFAIITHIEDSYVLSADLPERGKKFKTIREGQNGRYFLLQLDYADMDVIEGGEPLKIIAEENERKPSKRSSEIDEDIIIKQEEDNPVIFSGDDPCTFIPSEEDEVELTVMMVYTPAALNWAGSLNNLNNIIAQDIMRCNNASINSELGIAFTLVYSGETDYTEDPSAHIDLDRLQNKTDGFMDEIHNIRDSLAADFVHLLIFTQATGGLGYLLNRRYGREEFAFALTRVQQAGWTNTVIHEIGHNMSAHHAKGQNYQPGPTSWSNWPENSWTAGWRFQDNNDTYYCDLMTYTSSIYWPDGNGAMEISYFSTPNIIYQGQPIGDAVDGDNRRSILALKHYMAAYRDPQTLAYCNAAGTYGGRHWGINNTSINGNSVPSNGIIYEDLSFNQLGLSLEESNTMAVQVKDFWVDDRLLVWVDWNEDNDFDDPGELVYSSTTASVGLVYNFEINVPAGTTAGVKRMRLRAHDPTDGGNATPCGVSTYGSVLDLSIVVPETPMFTQLEPVGVGTSFSLPTTSNNGITGTWEPAPNNMSTTEYTFSPDEEECATLAFMTVEVIGPLPVNWLSFSAVEEKQAVRLLWVTAQEENNHYFSIERSRDARHWEAIGREEAQSDVYTDNTYLFWDRQPFTGLSYYRIKQVDWDGKYTYSSTASVNFSGAESPFRIYPNPAKNQLFLETHEAEPYEIVIYNIYGQRVYAGQNEKQIDISHLSQGVYQVHVVIGGKEAFTQKIIVSH